LGDGGVASLNAEPSEPAQRRALETIGLRVPDGNADLQGVSEVDARQLGGGVADEG
jgi:hypothetical protein